MRQQDCALFTSKGSSEVILRMDSPSFWMLVAQLAANIIDQISNYPIDEETEPTDGPGKILLSRMSWAPHGSVNAMMGQVKILYSVAQLIASDKENNTYAGLGLSGRETIAIVIHALNKFQEWKDVVCENKRKVHGPNWGSETGFHKANWTTFNEALLNLIHTQV